MLNPFIFFTSIIAADFTPTAPRRGMKPPATSLIFVRRVPANNTRCHGLRVYPVCVCNTVRLGQVRSRHNLKPSGTRFECVSGLSV